MNCRILHGDTKSTRNGSVIGSDVTYRVFLEYWIALRKVCSFRKTKQKCSTPFNRPREPVSSPLSFRFSTASTTRQEYQPHPLVPSLAASTFPFGALSWRYWELKILNFKLGHYNVVTKWLLEVLNVPPATLEIKPRVN
jgi:hypothetical protein